MPGSASYAILLLGTLLEALVVLCVFVSLGRYHILTHDGGWRSLTYRYFYFYSDALLTIVLYFGLISLCISVFEEMKVERYLRMGAIVLLAGTGWFTYAVVSQSSHRMLTYFAFELSQNLYFVGLILTYVLWAAVLKMRHTRTRLMQLILSMGIYFSLSAADFALENLYHSHSIFFGYFTPLFGCFL